MLSMAIVGIHGEFIIDLSSLHLQSDNKTVMIPVDYSENLQFNQTYFACTHYIIVCFRVVIQLILMSSKAFFVFPSFFTEFYIKSD